MKRPGSLTSMSPSDRLPARRSRSGRTSSGFHYDPSDVWESSSKRSFDGPSRKQTNSSCGEQRHHRGDDLPRVASVATLIGPARRVNSDAHGDPDCSDRFPERPCCRQDRERRRGQ